MNMNGSKYKRIISSVADWVLDHTKIVMPLILILCVVITVVIALNANERTKLEKEAELLAASTVEVETSANLGSIAVPEIPLEENAYPEVNDLLSHYYAALAEGDVDTAATIDEDLDDLARIKIQELAKYIDHYETVDVYTKSGLTPESYVTYVFTEVKLNDVEALVPGFQTYYVARNDAGNLVIKKSDLDSNIFEYIKTISLQDDVVDLNNKIAVAYNDLLASDKELNEFIAYMSEKIDENVGVVLAQIEQKETVADPVQEGQDGQDAQALTDPAQENTDSQLVVTTVKQAKATDVVNIRSSDSETADRLDKAEIGQEFTVLEQKGNGWSRVKYQGGEAYIKSDYLEIISEEDVAQTVTPEASASPAESASQVSTDGTVKVLESVRVRSTPGTDGELLGTVYGGDKLDLVEKMNNGWTKVTYKGKVAYVKSDYVE